MLDSGDGRDARRVGARCLAEQVHQAYPLRKQIQKGLKRGCQEQQVCAREASTSTTGQTAHGKLSKFPHFDQRLKDALAVCGAHGRSEIFLYLFLGKEASVVLLGNLALESSLFFETNLQ